MIYFIRHGESEANVKGVFAGQKDNSELSGRGQTQAVETAMVLFYEYPKIHKIICSPLKRTVQTANIIKKYFANELGYDVEIITDDRITEYDMGVLTGTPIKKIPSIEFISAEGAESVITFRSRVLSFFKEVSNHDENLLVISHAGVWKMLETTKNNQVPELFNDLEVVGNANIFDVSWTKNL